MYTDIKKYTVCDSEFTFICRSRSTRSGFAHDVELHHGNYFAGKHTCHYLNRTWECFRYQSAMLGVIQDKLKTFKLEAREQYKRNNGISRITAKHKSLLEAFVAQQSEEVELWKQYKMLYDIVEKG